MERKSVILIMMIFVSILSISRSLTTTEMRENTIRINALELVKVEKEQEKEQVIEAPKKEIPKKVTVVMDERALSFDFDKSVVKEQYVPILRNVIDYMVANNYDVTIVGHTDSKGSESYNIEGKELMTLVNDFQEAGIYEILFDASELNSGIYFYSLFKNNVLSDTKKLTLIK